MNNASETRERGTDLFEIHQSLVSYNKRYEALIERLVTVGSKLLDTPHALEPSKPGLSPESQPQGLLTDIRNELGSFDERNEKLMSAVSKFENLI